MLPAQPMFPALIAVEAGEIPHRLGAHALLMPLVQERSGALKWTKNPMAGKPMVFVFGVQARAAQQQQVQVQVQADAEWSAAEQVVRAQHESARFQLLVLAASMLQPARP